MCMIQTKQTSQQSGFALLITILVLSVVVAVTLALVELSIKQLKLSVDSTASEIAFHAANAGLECARYTRRIESDYFETGADVDVDCFGAVGNAAKEASLGFGTTGTGPTAQVYRYKWTIDWGVSPNERCTSIDTVVMVATTSVTIGAGGVGSLKNFINGYENDTKTCEAGERCTIMSAVGYSSACSAITGSGVLRREILLEL